MKSVADLIDEATKICKTKRALASRLGLTEQNLQGIYRGRRHLSAAQCADLADILGKDCAQVWALVTIEKETEPAMRARLSEAFFRRAILGAAIFGFGAVAFPGSSEARGTSQSLTPYTLSSVARSAWRAACRRLRAALGLRLLKPTRCAAVAALGAASRG